MSTGASLQWQWEPQVVVPMVLFAAVYMMGVGRLWRRAGAGRGIGYPQAAAFAGGMLLLVLALCSPLAPLSEQLFSAHMIVHEILMALAAPLLVLARPGGAAAWALPVTASRSVVRPLAWIAAPLMATLVQAAVIWIWHVPAYFRAATESEALHILQHVSFIATAMVFWFAMDRLSGRRAGVAVGYLFATSLHTGFLGALLMLAPRLWFPAHGAYGLSPLEDQQLGGAIMWMPGGMIYAAAALLVAAHWISGARPQRATV